MKKTLTASGIFLLLMSGCANNINQPAPKSNPKLPTVKQFKAYPDRNAMALFWTPIQNASGYYIQRYNPKTRKWKEVATLHDPFKSIYVNTHLQPNTIYRYRIAEFDKNGVPSMAVETKQKTLPPISPVIPLEAKPLTKGMVKIIFRPHQNERVKSYIIQKFDNQNAKWKEIATLSPRLNVEYIDKNLQDGQIYKYRIIAKSFDGIQSYPSKVIVVSTFKKPPVITNIHASTNLPHKIKLTWTPVKNVKYYKIYTSFSPDGMFVFYKTVKKPLFTDKINENGYIKYYKVTALSLHGTESDIKNTPVAMGETLPTPAKPVVSTNINGNKIEFIFTSPDNRAAKFLIIKKEKLGLFKSKETKFVTDKNSFTDTFNPKHSYTYDIYEVDKYGLISKNPATVSIGE